MGSDSYYFGLTRPCYISSYWLHWQGPVIFLKNIPLLRGSCCMHATSTLTVAWHSSSIGTVFIFQWNFDILELIGPGKNFKLFQMWVTEEWKFDCDSLVFVGFHLDNNVTMCSFKMSIIYKQNGSYNPKSLLRTY